MLIYLPITICVTLLTIAICIQKRHLLLTVLICYISGVFAGIVSLIHFFSSLRYVQNFNFETGSGSLQQAGILLAMAIISMVAGIGFTVIYARSSFRKIKYQEADEIDQRLMQMGLMPVQKHNRRKYLTDRKRQRRSRRSLGNYTAKYKYIDRTNPSFERIVEQIHEICNTCTSDELPRAVSELAWATAKENNKQLNWKNPTVFMTKAVYQDMKILYEVVEEYEERREQ